MNMAAELSWAWRRARSPIRLVVAAAILLGPVVLQVVAAEVELPTLAAPCFVAAILGAGLIALDRDRGLLGLVFAQPIRRSSYVLGRWAGATILCGTLFTAQLALSLAAALCLFEDPLPDARQVGTWLFLCWLSLAAMTAIMTLLSTMLGGIADASSLIGGAFLVALGADVAGRFGLRADSMAVARHVLRVIHPQLALETSHAGIAAVASNASLALVLAILVVNRREIRSRGEA